jgi:hypothetical protein
MEAGLRGGRTVFAWRQLRSWGRWLMGLAVLSVPLLEADLATASLYECRNAAGTLIYTDSPAQLERCQPVGGAGPSRLGTVGGTAPSSPLTPAAQSPAPPAAVPPTPHSSDPPVGSPAMAPSGGSPSTEESPCALGVNPLNPLSAPPCAATVPPTQTQQP